MEKYIKDGQVAILYSPGFGAGWYTWNTDRQDLIYCPFIVEKILNKEPLIDSEIEQKIGSAVYLGGLKDVKIKWVDQGTLFKINEYDGSESIELKESNNWMIA